MEYLAEANNVSPIKVRSLSREISPVRDFGTIWKLVRIFRAEKPHVVHTHTAKAGTVGRIAAMLVGTPVRVHTFHGHVFRGYFPPFVTAIFLEIERFLAKHTDCIIAISESQRKELVETYRIAPAEKVVTIPLGFDLEPFLSLDGKGGDLREELASNSGQPLIGWIGRLTAIKSPTSIIDCAARMRQLEVKPQFVVVGDGDLRHECEAKIDAEGLRECVRMVGWRRDLPAVYSSLDFVVATSRNEGTPVVLLEAMASARAIISTDVGGVRDLMTGPVQRVNGMDVFGNGILVDCDVSQIARAVEFLIKNPDLVRSMGQKGREFVIHRRFTQARLADDLAELYARLVRTRAGSSETAPFLEKEKASHLSTDNATV
jgi:glycosyltransferase involved in cell wall biosynthesis